MEGAVCWGEDGNAQSQPPGRAVKQRAVCWGARQGVAPARTCPLATRGLGPLSPDRPCRVCASLSLCWVDPRWADETCFARTDLLWKWRLSPRSGQNAALRVGPPVVWMLGDAHVPPPRRGVPSACWGLGCRISPPTPVSPCQLSGLPFSSSIAPAGDLSQSPCAS